MPRFNLPPMPDLVFANQPYGHSPLRRPFSIRRTSTIDMTWPAGLGAPMEMKGRARDLFTPASGQAHQILAYDEVDIEVAAGRKIHAIGASRLDARVQALVGMSGGGKMRKALEELLGDERSEGTPLHWLLDDFPGASLVSNWPLSRYARDWVERLRKTGGSPGKNGIMSAICAGFRPGSSALKSNGEPDISKSKTAIMPPLAHPDDPIGWHDLVPQNDLAMRRARRLDIWLDDIVHMDAHFQDSAVPPGGGERIGIHEYHVSATADRETFQLLSIKVDPRVLPFGECPAASPNATRMIGADLREFRTEVLLNLPGELGCTHLNDVLRGLADTPQIVERLAPLL